MPGPVAKRDDKRRNTATMKAEHVYTREGDLPVVQPPPVEHWCQAAKDWYTSLRTSAQAVFYEDSDWQVALTAGHVLNEWHHRRAATTMQEFRHLCGQLLATEGDRRRARLEIHRNAKAEAKKGATAVSEYKARLGVVAS